MSNPTFKTYKTPRGTEGRIAMLYPGGPIISAERVDNLGAWLLFWRTRAPLETPPCTNKRYAQLVAKHGLIAVVPWQRAAFGAAAGDPTRDLVINDKDGIVFPDKEGTCARLLEILGLHVRDANEHDSAPRPAVLN